MSHQATAWAVNQRVGDPAAKLLLLTLAEAASIEESECYPAIGTLAERIESSEDTVKRKLRVLVERGLIEIKARKRGNGSSTSNLYRLLLHGSPAGHQGTPANCPPPQIAPPLPPQIAPPTPAELCGGGGGHSSAPPRIVRKNSQRNSSADGAAADSPHAEFVRLWTEAFEECFGDPYAFAGGKDGAAVKALLGHGYAPVTLVDMAKRAWGARSRRGKAFHCGRSLTIAGFRSAFVEIREELRELGGVPARAATQPQETGVIDGI